MRFLRHHRARPHWWPHNEPWPPSGAAQAWARGRRRFVGRLALALGALLFFGVYGAASLVSMVVRGRPFEAHLSPAFLSIVALLLLFGFLTTFLRRVGMPMGGIVEA